jgi:hypothetical protein
VQVSELNDRDAPITESESGDLPEKVPITARLVLHESLTARRMATSERRASGAIC